MKLRSKGVREASNLFGKRLPFQRYNSVMPASAPKRQPDTDLPEHPSSGHHRTPQIYTLEATGLLLIATLILILTLVRYWHHFAWGVR
jgi:hypothetical protein